MLLLGKRLLGTPVMSLRIGGKVAETRDPVIDPRTLTIIAYEVDSPTLDQHPSFVRIADIRELSDIGMIIDDSDELVGESDVIKIKELRELGFSLPGMQVVDTRHKKLGRIDDYTIDTDSFVIQQLSIKAGFLGSLSTTGHMIHRSQIVEINNHTIVVKSTEKKLTTLDTSSAVHRTYNNPFRKPQQPEPTPAQPATRQTTSPQEHP